MQQGDIVMIGGGCPSTNNGRHQVEDYCRMCGGEVGLAALAEVANAHLIIAAPDLLEACKLARAAMAEKYNAAEIAVLDAAISKAEDNTQNDT